MFWNNDDSDSSKTDPSDNRQRYRRRATEHTVAGVGLGTASVGAFAVLGSVACPACVVAAPLLVGSGIWNAQRASQCDGDDQGTDGRVGPCPGDRIEFSG